MPVQLTDQLVVTTRVQKQLEKKAEIDLPLSTAMRVADIAERFVFLPFWITALFVAPIFFRMFSEGYWLFIVAWALVLPGALVWALDMILAKPRERRRALVTARVLELAQERQRRFEEQERFYASPEWIWLRSTVIQEEGRVCSDCGRQIGNDNDITVDHKKPRSKYPELSLKRENLRVVCRQCNSRKGDREWIEY